MRPAATLPPHARRRAGAADRTRRRCAQCHVGGRWRAVHHRRRERGADRVDPGGDGLDGRKRHARHQARETGRLPRRAAGRHLCGERHGEPLRDGEWAPVSRAVERAARFRGTHRDEPGTRRELPGGRDRWRTGTPTSRRTPGDARTGRGFPDARPQEPGWREEADGAKRRARVSRTLPAMMNAGGGGLQRITDISVTRTTASGRVGELRIVFEHGDVRVPGPDVRAVLRPASDQLLGSTSFQLSVTKDGGQVSRLVAAGAGWGHGVGFCQWGAVGRARAGQDYRKIVTTYFPGTNVERLY